MPELAEQPEARGGIRSECQRALVEAAQEAGAGTRQQRRAAARRFVRRHRRDASYLAWVLRSVAASSALAVTLLGFGAEPAHADAPSFAERTGAANPLDGKDVGNSSSAALGDLDGDGDLDIVAGAQSGPFRYYRNTGTAIAPAFVGLIGTANPLDGEPVDYSLPALGDLDGDGDLDLVAGESSGVFKYYENTGSAISPAFVERTGAANPLDGEDAGSFSAPALGDLDGDGDLDLVAGERYGTFLYYENTGSATSPAFAQRTGGANLFDGSDVGDLSTPALGDPDGDGDLDLIAGAADGTLRYFENIHLATSPAFVQRTGSANPLDGEDVGDDSAPALGDLDGDGDLDLLAGETDGTFLYYENTRSPAILGKLPFVPHTGAANPLDGESVESASSTPALGDLDADGDLDLVSGATDGTFGYFENTGSAASPAFAARTGAANPLDGENAGAASTPALGDLDGDGDLDLLAGEQLGTFLYFENTGSASSPAFVERTGVANPLAGAFVGLNSAPAFGDLDFDGDLDLVSGAADGTFSYFENTGSASSPAFVGRIGTANPLDGEDAGAASTPVLSDLDGDGDLDLIAGEQLGSFLYYENTGSALSPVFVLRTGRDNRVDGEDVGSSSAPALGDLDGDGDLDLVSGESLGGFLYFENPGSLVFWQLTGAANPLDGEDVLYFSAPALGDLDGDGDLDLVTGERFGAFLYYENTGSATDPAFAERTGAANPLAGESVGDISLPTLGDLDGDGDLDLVAGEAYGRFFYYENTGSATSPAFVERTGAANPLRNKTLVDYYSTPALGDLDGDGDLDLIAGSDFGSFTYFENTGSATNPVFVLAASPFGGYGVGYQSAPALGDLDGDGDLDVVSGEFSGTFVYFENTGSATSPAFIPRTGSANPLDGEDVGNRSRPALGDLDADGDLDLVAGDHSGEFATYYLPEPGQGWMLAAGLALLKLLERLRRRAP